MYGQSLFVGAVGIAVGHMVAKAPKIAAAERRKLKIEHVEDIDGDGRIGIYDYIIYFYKYFKYFVAWEDHNQKYLIVASAIIWTFVGVAYGMMSEKWSFGSSLYFSLNTLIEMGLTAPTCIGDSDTNCEFGTFNGIFVSIYMIIGCPLFALAFGQFATVMIERAVREHEKNILHTPLTAEEYRFAANLYGDDELISLSEFTILELLRLQRVTMEDLKDIKDIFCAIDDTSTGNVDQSMLLKNNLIKTSYSPSQNLPKNRNQAPISPPQNLNKKIDEREPLINLPSAVANPILKTQSYASIMVEPPCNSMKRAVTTNHIPSERIKRLSVDEYNDLVVPLAASTVLPNNEDKEEICDEEDTEGDTNYSALRETDEDDIELQTQL
jgi:hypothetical protein